MPVLGVWLQLLADGEISMGGAVVLAAVGVMGVGDLHAANGVSAMDDKSRRANARRNSFIEKSFLVVLFCTMNTNLHK